MRVSEHDLRDDLGAVRAIGVVAPVLDHAARRAFSGALAALQDERVPLAVRERRLNRLEQRAFHENARRCLRRGCRAGSRCEPAALTLRVARGRGGAQDASRGSHHDALFLSGLWK